MQTTLIDIQTLKSSAAVKRPQMPKEIFVVLRHGLVKKNNFIQDSGVEQIEIFYLIRYWHMGNSRNASATVAITAVQIANNICIESKKKNIT